MSTVNPSVETESTPSLSAQEALGLLELAEIASRAKNLEELESLLPAVVRLTQSSSAALCIADERLAAPCFFPCGMSPQAASDLERLCVEEFERRSGLDDWRSAVVPTADLSLHPWQTDSGCNGLLALAEPGNTVSPQALERLLRLLAATVDRLVEQATVDRQIAHLNTYMTVSSMLVQSLDLHDTLEAVLYCCMDAIMAEAASVLLLDDDMSSFRFYHVEGPAKPGLRDAVLPADQGIAGYVLRTQEPVIIDDAHSDPRHYEEMDSESGFQTRNMIAVPLVIGNEPIGVLEVLNKVDGDTFAQDEQMLLLSIADEIALAIRNAKTFEYVANSYCRIRQGQSSCRGCQRPLGAWTPCVQYQKTMVSGLWQISDLMGPGSSG